MLAHDLVKSGVPRSKIVFALCRVGNSPSEVQDARDYLAQSSYPVLAGEIPEQVGYRRASDEGRALTETRFSSLNARAEQLVQAMVDKISELANPSRNHTSRNQAAKKRSVA